MMADETDTTTYAHSEHKGSDVLMSFLTPTLTQGCSPVRFSGCRDRQDLWI